MFYRLRGISYLILCLFLLPISAKAQTGANASLSDPNTDAFPIIEAYLDVRDAQGDFVRDLSAEQVRVLENEVPLPITEIRQLRPGVQVVVALNPGPSFGIRNSKAISRYDYIKEALANWAKSRQCSTLDDWSLLITGGPSISHVSDPMQWLATLETEQVDARSAIPDLDILFRAMSLASDPPARSGMGRAILFITPPPEGDSTQSIENLAAQANEQGISIFVWMISSPGAFATKSVEQLTQLAERTGGEFFPYTGEEILPSPEEYLEPRRAIYHLAYQSKIMESGSHQVLVQVQIGAEQVETNVQNFEINIQPPQPAFVAPPIQILRKPPPKGENIEQDPGAEISPQEQDVQVVFDFPDGRKRSLVQSVLYVDGVPVAENLEPPFDQFAWELEPYNTDGIYKLQVKAKDELGLTGTSIEVPVQISVDHPAQDPWSVFQKNGPLISVLVVLLAGALLFLVLVIGGKLRPGTLRITRYNTSKIDPITQPIHIENESASSRLPSWVTRLHWPQRHDAPKAYAFLSRISDADQLTIAPPIPITTEDVTLGSDPQQATLVIDDPSIEALHARLQRHEDGSFRLADSGSIAGTWVNYTPISKEGTKLEHGDLVHIGRIGFRFSLRKPTQIRKPVVIAETHPGEPSQEPRS